MKIMKHIINYLGALLAVALIGATFAACAEDDEGSANVGLGIKTFFPTKVVTNQPMTINGSGFNDVKEIEFPGGTKVTDFEIVGNDMIRLKAPSGIPAEGGNIKVRTDNDEAESRLPLTLGHTNVSGFSKQPGEEAAGGELITVYGTDLEFINQVELLDAEGEPQFIDHKDFYRKGTSNLIFRVPLKNIPEESFVGYLHTYDGQKIAMPELAYVPAKDEGHWETVKTIIWKNDGSLGEVSWNGIYRFAPESNSTGEECYTVPQETWEQLKANVFYVTIKGESPQIRVTTGWWSGSLSGDADIMPGNELLTDNGDGTWTIKVDLSTAPELLGLVDSQHLLFTGSGFTVEEIYFIDIISGGGGGSKEYDISAFTLYEDRSANLSWPYKPSWGDGTGKVRIMRGLGDPALESMGLTTSSKFIVYKEVGTTGQIQFNDPNWGDLNAGCNDWEGSAETIEVPITEAMLKCISGEVSDGWSDTALILQGDGLTVTKIVIVP